MCVIGLIVVAVSDGVTVATTAADDVDAAVTVVGDDIESVVAN